jgi:hypothetical protein
MERRKVEDEKEITFLFILFLAGILIFSGALLLFN